MGTDDTDANVAATATAAAGAPSPTKPAELVHEVGRYRIEAVLGAGGMGVVYRAFEPDLERHVALKVLADARETSARERLLREARAMARLNHPHVITVFEVGTAKSQDYVAMELVDGGTLADWLRAEKRSTREIITAFLQAGRGLAAAHAAGIIHRDFKPHNILRWKHGSVAVTDFGLAREVGDTAALDETASRNTPTPLEGMTATGAIMGTPAYMAPEQWTGATVGAEADQFAFCVALWEALTGARPFTVEETRGTLPELDMAKIPRRLRELVRRGLEPDPAKRWPSMADVLVRLERALAVRGLVFALGGAVVTTIAAIAILLARGSHDTCRAPLIGADATAALLPALRAHHQEPGARAIDRDLGAWTLAREHACTVEPELRVKQLACLDGVMARIDAAARVGVDAPVPHVDLAEMLVDPALCRSDAPPRLTPRISPAWRAVWAREYGEEVNPEPFTRKVADRLLAATAGDPCAATAVHLYAIQIDPSLAERRAELDEAGNLAARCDDDRMRYAVAVAAAGWEAAELASDGLEAAIKRAESALVRVEQRDTTADIDMLRTTVLTRANRLDEAIAMGLRAVDGYRARHRMVAMMSASVQVMNLHQVLGTAADFAAEAKLVEQISTDATAELGADDPNVAKTDYLRGQILYWGGDLTRAHAIYDRLRKPEPIGDGRRVRGRVVDVGGAPVAGAKITSGCCLQGDSLGAVVAFGDGVGKQRTATSDTDGRFELPESVSTGTIIAESGARRSRPLEIAGEPQLVLEPTSRIEGHVALGGMLSTNVNVRVTDPLSPTISYTIVAPVRPDGSYEIAGVPRGRVQIMITTQRRNQTLSTTRFVDTKDDVIRDVDFVLQEGARTVNVLVRGTTTEAPPKAIAYVVAGKVASMNQREFNALATAVTTMWASPMQGEHAPQPVLARAHAGDLLATFEHAPGGELSACAHAMPLDSSNKTTWEKAAKQPEKLLIPCVPIGARDEVVVVEIPPFPRLD